MGTDPVAGKRVHFVGIGGCGMCGLARMVRQAGAICTGSDMARSSITDALTAEGFGVALEQTAAAVPADCELLVISAAIGAEHPEVVEARRRGVRIIKYAQMLGELMIGRTGIAIAGTHGKSSTTSMLSHILIRCGLDPSFIVGANCRQIGGGSRTGRSNILVAEACEFDRSFHNFHPTHAVILNVEEDHMEVYGTLDAVVEAFRVFAAKLPGAGEGVSPQGREGVSPHFLKAENGDRPRPGGLLLINHEMPHRLTITAGLNCQVETIGFAPQADWRVEVGVAQPPSAGSSNGLGPAMPLVRLYERGHCVARWASPLPGEHMAYNAAAAAVLAHRVGAPWDGIAQAIATFQGLDRRMQLIGRRPAPVLGIPRISGIADPGQVTVVDDYGHHPTEIDTTLRALRRHYAPKRLICVFQPHQHSRTRFLMEQFAASFSEADIVIVPQIYFVRDSEQERHAVTAADLVDRLRQRGRHALHLYPFEAIVEHLAVIARPGDLIVTMGAGDVWKVARDFMQV
jgi:UDP-N-acetylmuramate--alanine ligase